METNNENVDHTVFNIDNNKIDADNIQAIDKNNIYTDNIQAIDENKQDNKISVHIRVKPPSKEPLWDVNENGLGCTKNIKSTRFSCFKSIHINDSIIDIYSDQIAKNIKCFINQENVTIVAYGQTGSGKTYTMMGDYKSKVPGLIFISLKDILNEVGNTIKSCIYMSYMEIYNEKVYDLAALKELKILSKDNRTVIPSLHLQKVKTIHDAESFLKKCEVNRKVSATEFNVNSSRSHTIIQIKNGKAILNFIDLAGSEKASINDSRKQEGAHINKSLLALGKLINNLVMNKYMGFRESKLTRVLQQSLNSDTRFIALCMISSVEKCLAESLNTLKFGERLSSVESKKLEPALIINEEIIDTESTNQEILKINDAFNINSHSFFEQNIEMLLECDQNNNLEENTNVEKNKSNNISFEKNLNFNNSCKNCKCSQEKFIKIKNDNDLDNIFNILKTESSDNLNNIDNNKGLVEINKFGILKLNPKLEKHLVYKMDGDIQLLDLKPFKYKNKMDMIKIRSERLSMYKNKKNTVLGLQITNFINSSADNLINSNYIDKNEIFNNKTEHSLIGSCAQYDTIESHDTAENNSVAMSNLLTDSDKLINDQNKIDELSYKDYTNNDNLFLNTSPLIHEDQNNSILTKNAYIDEIFNDEMYLNENFIILKKLTNMQNISSNITEFYEKRINTLEKQVLDLLKRHPNRHFKDIFYLEKQVFDVIKKMMNAHRNEE